MNSTEMSEEVEPIADPIISYTSSDGNGTRVMLALFTSILYFLTFFGSVIFIYFRRVFPIKGRKPSLVLLMVVSSLC